MKKLAFVFMDDFIHSSKQILPFLPGYFDYSKWQVCVLKNWDSVCMTTAPDVIVNFRDAQFNWRQETDNFYESDISCQIAQFVLREGCGYVAAHAGTSMIPRDHPLRTQVLKGSAVSYKGNLMENLLADKGLPGASPFNAFADVTFVPEGEHPILEGISEFTVRDEQYRVELENGSDAVVLGRLVSDAAGSSIGAWASESGKGRAAGIALGHLSGSREHVMEQRLIANAIRWAGRAEP